MSLCTQCREAEAMYQIGHHLICINCYAKIQQAEALRAQALQQSLAGINNMQNYLSDMMAFSMGITPSLPKHPVPNQQHNHFNNPVMNNMNIQNSQIGVLNTGTISNVKSIVASINVLGQAGAVEFATALDRLSTSVLQSPELGVNVKEEAIQQVELISTQAAKPADQRSMGLIKPTVTALADTMTSVSALSDDWQKCEAAINEYFGLIGKTEE